MFLAIKEIQREKTRYGLIIFMIFLISYLIFMLSSLALGLSDENTQAVQNAWHTQSVVLNKNANVSLSQSVLTKDDVKNIKLNNKDAYVGLAGLVAKSKDRPTMSAQFIGLNKDQYIYKTEQIVAGHKADSDHQVTVDESFKQKGYKLGDKITLNGSTDKYKIVGFVQNAKINIAPIVYGSMATWKTLKMGAPNIYASGIISQNKLDVKTKNLKTYSVKTFIDKLPGYTAQNMTFEMMIGFLFVISLIVIAVFLYILTMQKMQNFAVMRAQGIPSKTLVGATIAQSVILVTIGSLLGLLVMAIFAVALGSKVPMNFTPTIMISGVVGMILMGIIGSLIPIRQILKVDPAQAIGG